MAAQNGVEIIDLTRSSPPVDATKEPGEISSRAVSKGAEPEWSTRRGKRKRKTTGKDVLVDETPGASTATSRAQSVQRETAGPSTGQSSAAPEAKGEGEETQRKKRKSRSEKKNKSRNASPPARSQQAEEAQDDLSSLFVIDTAPSQVPTNITFRDPTAGPFKPTSTVSAGKKDAADSSALLLPAHVSVLDAPDGVPVEIIHSPEPDSDAESYIEYLDYDDRTAPGLVRYFAEPSADVKQSKFVCKNCGAENEHKTYECPVLICLMCGARDEHSTRSCPVSKTCFSCGMRGHINRNCPNRFSARANNYDDCDRCGSSTHNTKECPTIWRLYEYLTDTERTAALRNRDEKEALKFGEGGEGYIARDEWCYNCGGSGHPTEFQDCNVVPHPYDFPREPSAFSLYNTMSGPFFDPAAEPNQPEPQSRRQPRDWEQGNTVGDGWGFDAPVNVGKQGRRKGRERLERRARELEDAEDDADDWFGSARNARNRGDAPRGGAGKRISFGDSMKGGGRFEDINARMGSRHPAAEGVSERPRSYGGDSRRGQGGLAERMSKSSPRGDSERRGRGRDERREHERGGRDERRDREKGGREERRDRERSGRSDPDRGNRSTRRDDRGPRYKGGYTR